MSAASLHLFTDDGEDPGVVVCPECGRDFDAFDRPGEPGYFAALHNRMHHGGHPVAFVTTVDDPTEPVNPRDDDTTAAGGPECAYCGGPIPAETPKALYCRQACRQAAFKVRQAAGQRRAVVWLDDVLHLLRFGVRLDEIAARLDVTPASVLRAVERTEHVTPPELTELDVAALRRLVAADQARSRDDAEAERRRSYGRGRGRAA